MSAILAGPPVLEWSFYHLEGVGFRPSEGASQRDKDSYWLIGGKLSPRISIVEGAMIIGPGDWRVRISKGIVLGSGDIGVRVGQKTWELASCYEPVGVSCDLRGTVAMLTVPRPDRLDFIFESHGSLVVTYPFTVYFEWVGP